MRNVFFASLIVATGLAGCDTYTQDDFEAEYVVEAYLVAGSPLPEIRLSTTAPVTSRYRFEDHGVTDAEVEVHLLGSDGEVADTYRYTLEQPGVFVPVDSGLVRPERSYALDVRILGDGVTLRSVTRVPGLFEILSVNTDTLGYQEAEQLEARVTRSAYPGRQSIYAFTTIALDTTNYGLTPAYASLVESTDGITADDLTRNYSGLSNESSASYETDAEGNLLLRLPWAAIAFYGPNEITAAAVDDNLYDFLRSLDAFSMIPGQMENLIDHIEGGRGVFGSMAEERTHVFVQPPPTP